MSLIVRDATLEDAEDILAIYSFAPINKHAMIAGIEPLNAGSIGLHASLGFIEVARMPEVGCKFGRWLDLVFMQKRLASGVRP